MEENRKIDFGKIFRGDSIIWIVFFTFMLVSIMEQFSAGSALTYKYGSISGPILRHTASLLAGAVIMFILSYIPVRWLRSPWIVWLAYGGTCVMQLMTFTSFGRKYNGARRWIEIHGQLIQPSEFLKVALMLLVARLMWRYQELKYKNEELSKAYYWGALVAILVPAVLVIHSNMSSAIMMLVAGGFVLFLGGLEKKHIAIIGGAAVILFGGLYTLHLNGMKLGGHMDSGMNRVDHIWKPTDPATAYLINKDSTDFQEKMCKVAIANGRMPKGPGNSEVRDKLPLAFADSIFAICIEDLGLLGAILLIMLYFVILYRGGHFAVHSPDVFTALIVSGLSLMLTMQAIISMLVVCGFGPNTGQPLPFISWGVWDILSMSAVLGVILSASHHIKNGADEPSSQKEEAVVTPKTTRRRRRKESDIIEDLD